LEQAESTSRPQYHHGDLKESLILSATQLVRELGPDKFSMADACKLAGVSKAAPYRHFANKDALLKSVITRGFEQLRLDMVAASDGLVSGSNIRITKIGLTYLAFAVKEPALFRLMFGANSFIEDHDSEMIGRPTFQILLDEIIARTHYQDVEKLMSIAFPLWTLVHGASTLTIDDSYNRIYPDSNIEQMIIEATERLLASFPEPS
jgi:AcrR family transcriptional regulator